MEEFKKIFKETISEGELKEIENLIQKFKLGDTNGSPEEENRSCFGQCLYDAVLSENCTTDLVQLLLDSGADVNYVDPLHQSVLLKAIDGRSVNFRVQIIDCLIQNGADINHENINGQTDFLHLFSKGGIPNLVLVGLIEKVSNILERDIQTGGGLLHLVPNCCEKDKTVLLKKLIEKGVAINGRDNNGDTPLHVTAGAGDMTSMKYLIENGADVLAKNRLGETLFHYLADSLHLMGVQEVTYLLLEKGLDINEKDKSGKTVLHHAMMSKETTTETLVELLKHNVTVNVKDSRGRNEIFCAVEEVDINYNQAELEQRAEVIKNLVNAGVCVNDQDDNGISPLHYATLKNDLDILVGLLDCGADVMQKSNTGTTALHWSTRHYNMLHVLIHFYLDGGHDLNVKDVYGSTALHWAVWLKNKSAAQSLLQVGCDYTIKDMFGRTPGEFADIVHFSHFSWLIEGDRFEKLEFLELQDPKLECSGADPLMACPFLRYIKKEDGALSLEMYLDHLNLHKTSLQSCWQKSISLKNMGLFYALEDNRWIPGTFDHLISLLAERLSEKHPLFSCEIKLAGSMHEETKVKIPNEFDYLFIMSHISKSFDPFENDEVPENFVKVKLKSGKDRSTYSKYLTTNDFLDSRLFIQDFYAAINEEIQLILKNCPSFNHIVLVQDLKEIWCSLSELRFLVFGREAKQFETSVDIVPCLEFEGWIPKNIRELNAKFCANFSRERFAAIMKTPDRCHVKDFTLFYRISFAYLEQSIIKTIPYHIKKAYILLKILIESGYLPKVVDHDHGKAIKSYVTTYHLKTCLLHEWYEYHERVQSDENNGDTTKDWAMKILDRYQRSIEKRFLPSFFNPKKNLFGIEAMNDGMHDPDIFVQLAGLLQYILRVAVGEEIIYSRK